MMAAICNSEFLMPAESSRQRKKLPCYHNETGLLLYHDGTREACLDLSGISGTAMSGNNAMGKCRKLVLVVLE